jgi:hypothetical protein
MKKLLLTMCFLLTACGQEKFEVDDVQTSGNSTQPNINIDLDFINNNVNTINQTVLNTLLNYNLANYTNSGYGGVPPRCNKNQTTHQDSNGHIVCVKKEYKENLVCNLYDLSIPRPTSLPDMSNMNHVYMFQVDKFNIGNNNYSLGLPLIPDTSIRSQYLEYYGIICKGFVKSSSRQAVELKTISDDGIKVTLNNTTVLQNLTQHAPTTDTMNVLLKKGYNKIKVEWYQGPRTQIALDLKINNTYPQFFRK